MRRYHNLVIAACFVIATLRDGASSRHDFSLIKSQKQLIKQEVFAPGAKMLMSEKENLFQELFEELRPLFEPTK